MTGDGSLAPCRIPIIVHVSSASSLSFAATARAHALDPGMPNTSSRDRTNVLGGIYGIIRAGEEEEEGHAAWSTTDTYHP